MYHISFQFDRETKNTRRYAEMSAEDDDGNPLEPVIGPLYVQKTALRELGNPDKIIVTIDVEQ